MQLSTMITIVLGFATCVSPALVAWINNRHSRALRKIELEASESLKKLELQANESLKKIELNAELSRTFVLSERDQKYKIVFNFIDVASNYIFDCNNVTLYSKLISAHSECLTIGFRWSDFEGYMQYIKPPISDLSLSDHAIEQMQFCLQSIAGKFNDMLKESLTSAFIE